jgi:hypothetical protein
MAQFFDSQSVSHTWPDHEYYRHIRTSEPLRTDCGRHIDSRRVRATSVCGTDLPRCHECSAVRPTWDFAEDRHFSGTMQRQLLALDFLEQAKADPYVREQTLVAYIAASRDAGLSEAHIADALGYTEAKVDELGKGRLSGAHTLD